MALARAFLAVIPQRSEGICFSTPYTAGCPIHDRSIVISGMDDPDPPNLTLAVRAGPPSA